MQDDVVKMVKQIRVAILDATRDGRLTDPSEEIDSHLEFLTKLEVLPEKPAQKPRAKGNRGRPKKEEGKEKLEEKPEEKPESRSQSEAKPAEPPKSGVQRIGERTYRSENAAQQTT